MAQDEKVIQLITILDQQLRERSSSSIAMYYRKEPTAKVKVAFDSSGTLRVVLDEEQQQWLNEYSDFRGASAEQFEEKIVALRSGLKEDGTTSANSLCTLFFTKLNTTREHGNTNVNVDMYFKTEDLLGLQITEIQRALEGKYTKDYINPKKLAGMVYGQSNINADEEEAGDEVTVYSKLKWMIQNGAKQIILTGAPGTGKTFGAQKIVAELITGDDGALIEEVEHHERYAFVQFHSSYDYTDFVEGLRPYKVPGQTDIGFRLEDGIFRVFCNQARGKDENYYFIIDEINRADLSKVFGELMFGLEENYRGKWFNTQYSSLRYSMAAAGERQPDGSAVDVKFSIPENVIIIGTMNDIDRSVEAFDFALRRRFLWQEVKADEVMEEAVLSMLRDSPMQENDKKALIEAALDLNSTISAVGSAFGLNEHYHMGPAYFGKTRHANVQEAKLEIWELRVASILREYVRGYDAGKIEGFMKACRQAFLGVAKAGV